MRRDVRGSPKFERTDLSQKGKTENNNNKDVLGGNQLPENHGGKNQKSQKTAKVLSSILTKCILELRESRGGG